MGNGRLYKIERFHTAGTSESVRLKVTALNLFHPTASPLLQKVGFSSIVTQSPQGRGEELEGYANLASIFDHTLQCSDIFFCHAGGNLVLLQTFKAFARFVKGCAHIFLSAIRKDGNHHAPIQRHSFL